MLVAHQTISPHMRECIENCKNCGAICLETMSHCLAMGGKHAEARHISVLVQCVEICRTSAGFMLLGSDAHPRVCGVCAEICRACADSCEKLAGEDNLMRQCAEMCRRCAESCERMAGTSARRAG
jgi:hypothetical protein